MGLFNIHVHHHYLSEKLLMRIIAQGEKIMADLSNITREVQETNTVVDSAIVLLNELGGLIRANVTDQAALNDLANTLDAKAAELAVAIAANTPAEEPSPSE